MIPTTLGAFLAFLALVAPGIVFEIRRERRRPALEESTFREISRTGLVSLVLTLVSVLVVLAVSAALPDVFPDVKNWINSGSEYVKDAYWRIVLALALEVALACGLALLLDVIFRRRERGNISPYSAWHEVFRIRTPPGAHPWAHLTIEGGVEYHGYVYQFTSVSDPELREITLVGPGLSMQKGQVSKGLASWDSVTIQAKRILSLEVTYMSKGQIIRPKSSRVPSQASA
jgi:hypothetical protein